MEIIDTVGYKVLHAEARQMLKLTEAVAGFGS
jgi:hypothetical protein